MTAASAASASATCRLSAANVAGGGVRFGENTPLRTPSSAPTECVTVDETWYANGNMSGARRACTISSGASPRSAQNASPLSSRPATAPSVCWNTGTVAEYSVNAIGHLGQ